MAVGIQEKTAKQLNMVEGVQIFVGSAGVKQEKRKDLTLFMLSSGAEVAAVFTQNRFCAAPVSVSKKHLATGKRVRALIVNTGNANAGTGAQGRNDAEMVCAGVAHQVNCESDQVLPFSTGVIMEMLPVERILDALPKLKPSYWDGAARAIMTTDTVPKSASVGGIVGGHRVNVTGVAKGSGMICPNMATMLSFVATDAKAPKEVLEQMCREVADETFNCVTVDGDMSTNDSFVLIATGKAKLQVESVRDPLYAELKKLVAQVCLELAQGIVRDGEGATKFIEIEVMGARSRLEARRVAYAVAHSPLVKTAFYASDANLGRILCAIGYSGIGDLDVEKVRVYLDNMLVCEKGGRADLYHDEDGMRVMQKDEIKVRVDLGRGEVEAKVYTCDLSHRYVEINGSYRT